VATPALLAALALTPLPPLAFAASLALFNWAPGAALLRLLRLDRLWSGPARLVFAAGLSISLAPVLLDAVWHGSNRPAAAVLAVAVACGVLELAALWHGLASPFDLLLRRPLADSTGARLLLSVMAAWVALCVVGPYWPTDAAGAPIPALIHDFIKHHAVLLSLERSPLPLHSPFFAAGAAEPVYYYHYFYLAPASVRACCPSASIQLAFAVQAATVAVIVAGLAALLVRRVHGGRNAPVLAFALMSVVGGLDAIPLLLERAPAITLDTWADPMYRIHNLFTQMVWTPQNVQGLLILLTAALVLSHTGVSAAWIALGPLLVASLCGSTIWVAVAALPASAVAVVLWLWSVRTEAGVGRKLLGVAVAAALGALLSAAQVSGYAEMSARHPESGLTIAWPLSPNALFDDYFGPGPLANVLDLVWRVPFEFGALALFPLLVPRAVWRRWLADPGGRLLLLAGVAGLCAFVFVRSDFTYNDFGQKVIFPALAAGAVLGACILRGDARDAETRPPGGDPGPRLLDTWIQGFPIALLVAAVLIIGSAVGIYQSPLAAVRRFLPVENRLGGLVSEAMVRAHAEAPLARFLRAELPGDAVIQPDWRPDRLDLLQRCGRRFGVTELERDTMVFQPTDGRAHAEALAGLRSAIESDADARALAATMHSLSVTHVVLGATERQRWPRLERFDDAAAFERVFRDGDLAVYRVRE